MKLDRRITLPLCALLLAGAGALLSCGDTAANTPAVTDAPGTAPAETEAAAPEKTVIPYDYELGQYDGYAFTILNEDETENNWANCRIAPDELNGDLINDALYNRKVRTEDLLNVTIREERIKGDNLASQTKKLVQAGDATYDSISNRNNEIASLATAGYFANMRNIPEMHFDRPWWDSVICDASTLDGKLFFASSDISLFAFEATWVIYFNETLFNRFDIEYPYQLVRDGKWTLDAMYNIIKEGTVVNDTDYNPTGNNSYGMITHNQFIGVLLAGAGEELVSVGKDGIPAFHEPTERFYSLAEKIINITGPKGQYYDRVTTPLASGGNDVTVEFMYGTFLMCSETLGHIATLRSMEDGLGILPAPKYDEAQADYRSMVATWGVEMTTIPATNTELTRTGQILDYLAYQSYISLMEPYYDQYLTMKGARNEDSAEMLSIIRNTRVAHVGYLFNWSNSMEEPIREALMKGKNDVASLVAKNQAKVEKAIDKTMTKWAELG
ncbi:MAG: hypothetical protein MJ175_00940 [Clostridia bacterium]|nr:hypothetical protein [Clostridia bacterium]